jgi:hypothetical protein
VSTAVACLALLALGAFVADPRVDRTVATHVPATRFFANAWPLTIAASAFIGSFAFGRHGGLADVIVGLLVYYGA